MVAPEGIIYEYKTSEQLTKCTNLNIYTMSMLEILRNCSLTRDADEYILNAEVLPIIG